MYISKKKAEKAHEGKCENPKIVKVNRVVTATTNIKSGSRVKSLRSCWKCVNCNWYYGD